MATQQSPSPAPTDLPPKKSRVVAPLLALLAGAAIFGAAMYAVQEWRIKDLTRNYESALRDERNATAMAKSKAEEPASTEKEPARVDTTPTATTTLSIGPNDDIDAIMARVSSLGRSTELQCLSFYAFIGDGKPKQVERGDLADPDVKGRLLAAIPENVPEREALVERIVRDMPGDLSPAALCFRNDNAYVTYYNDTYSEVYVAKWTMDPVAHLRSFTPVTTMDGVYGMFSSDAVDGKTLIRTGYGDAGFFWWSYYALDDASSATDLIEKCSMQFILEGDDDTAHKVEWQCDRRYVPGQE